MLLIDDEYFNNLKDMDMAKTSIMARMRTGTRQICTSSIFKNSSQNGDEFG